MTQGRGGVLVCLEGIDQSGKRTQASLLFEKLRDLGHSVSLISFPDYSTLIGREIRSILLGERSYPPQVRHMLLSANRWEAVQEIVGDLMSKDVVILNRYYASNYAYGLANGLALDWLANLDRGLPDPQLTIFIDISPGTSLARKEVHRDIHEQDLDFLAGVRRNYLDLAKRFGWAVIDGERHVEEVARDIWIKVAGLLEEKRH